MGSLLRFFKLFSSKLQVALLPLFSDFDVFLVLFFTFELPILLEGHYSLKFVELNFSEFSICVARILFGFLDISANFDILLLLELFENLQMGFLVDLFLRAVLFLKSPFEEFFFHLIILLLWRVNFLLRRDCVEFASFGVN